MAVVTFLCGFETSVMRSENISETETKKCRGLLHISDIYEG